MMPNWLTLTIGLLSAGLDTFGIRVGTEEPKFAVVGEAGRVAIRRYEPRIAAVVVVQGADEAARSDGFKRLAGYLFGANQQNQDIAMTAPVVQAPSETIAMTAPVVQLPHAGGGWEVAFVMPSRYTLAELPKPKDAGIELRPLPTQTYAVLRFTGSRDAKAVEQRKQELLNLLAASTWHPVGVPVAWFYDPPWTIPWVRRNEVAVEVTAPN